MKVTTSILISLIHEYSKKKLSSNKQLAFNISEIHSFHESNLEIQGVRLADGSSDAHILYICSNIEEVIPTAKNSAFALISRAFQPLPKSSVDLFEIVTDEEPLSILYKIYNLILSLQNWDQKLQENILSPYHFFQLFSIGREIYPYPFCLINHDFTIVGMTKDMYQLSPTGERPKNDKISDYRAGELLNDPDFQKTSSVTGIYTYPSHQKNTTRLCINVTQNGNYLGRVLSDVKDDTPGIRALLWHLADYLKRGFLSYTDDVMVSRANDSLHQLVSDLLINEKSHIDDIPLILSRYHWDEDSLYRVAVISLSHQQSNLTLRPYLSNLLEKKFKNSCAVSEGDTIALISPSPSDEKEYQKELLSATSTWSLKIGVSSPISFKNLKTGYQQAIFALQCEANSNDDTNCRFFSTCRIEYIVTILKQEMPDEDFCHPGIRKLISKDKKENTNNEELIWELICSGFNVTKAAEKCYVNRSTFIRRLHKISQITGINFNAPLDPDTLFDLLISFRFIQHSSKL